MYYLTMRTCNSHVVSTPIILHLHETGSLVLRPSHRPVFDCLQYAKTEEVALESLSFESTFVDKVGERGTFVQVLQFQC